MTTRVAPGVYTSVVDISEFVESVPSTIGFISLICEKGPDNELVLTNSREFNQIFGEPNITYAGSAFGQGPYVANSFLKESDSLYVIRCMPYDDATIENDDEEAMTSATYANLVVWVQEVNESDSSAAVIVSAYSGSFENEDDIDTLIATNAYGSADTELESTDVNAAVVIYGLGRGSFYNNFQVNLSLSANPNKAADGIYILDIFKKQDNTSSEDTYDPDWAIVSSFEVSFDPEAKDDTLDSMFIEDIINAYFPELRCKADRDLLKYIESRRVDEDDPFTVDFSSEFNSFVDDDFNIVASQVAGIQLDGGSDGNLFKANGNIDVSIATTLLTQAYRATLPRTRSTGEALLEEVRDHQNYHFNVVFDAGYPTDVKSAIVDLVDFRKDSVAILDNGDNRSFSNGLARRKGTDPFESENHSAYDSKYVAMFEPFSKINDPWTGRDVWITPVYHMANIIPFTDNIAEVWYPSAGFNRATIPSIKELRYSPSIGQREQFELNQINPIVKFNTGYTVFGNKTTQKRNTSFSELSITRLYLTLKRALEQFAQFYIWELNDEATWQAIRTEVARYLKTIQNRRGIEQFSVEVGADDYDKKAGRVFVKVAITPVRAIKQIFLQFYVK